MNEKKMVIKHGKSQTVPFSDHFPTSLPPWFRGFPNDRRARFMKRCRGVDPRRGRLGASAAGKTIHQGKLGETWWDSHETR